MAEPISRGELEEAVELWGIRLGTADPPSWRVSTLRMANAAQAILDGEPADWCEEHGAQRMKDPQRCYRSWPDGDPCQFQTYVRVKVEP